MKLNCTYILQFEMRFPCTISKSPSTYLDQQHSAIIIHNKRIAYMCCLHMSNGESVVQNSMLIPVEMFTLVMCKTNQGNVQKT